MASPKAADWYDASTNMWTSQLNARASTSSGSSSSSGKGGGKVVGFAGVDTGNKYQVGRVYTLPNGDKAVANADGTFTNQRNGVVTAGSSLDRNATFYVAQSVVPTGGGSASGSTVVSTTGKGVATKGPGNTGHGTAKPGASGSGPAAQVVQSGAVTGIASPFTQLTPVYQPNATSVVIGGRPVKPDQGWSDAAEVEQRYGEAEFLSPAWFYSWGVTAVDSAKNLEDIASEINMNVTQPFWRSVSERVNAPIPKQEPVDWGQPSF